MNNHKHRYAKGDLETKFHMLICFICRYILLLLFLLLLLLIFIFNLIFQKIEKTRIQNLKSKITIQVFPKTKIYR